VKAVSFFIEGIYIMVKSLGQSIFIDSSGNTIVNLNGTIIKKDPSGGIVASDASNNTLDGTFNNIDVSGNATINGIINQAIQLDVSGSILPTRNLVYDLGAPDKRWNDLYLSGNTIDLSGTLLSRHTDGSLMVHDSNNNMVNLRANNIIAEGNLTVSGTTTTVNSSTVTVQDPIITLGSDITNNKDKGIEFKYGISKTGFFGYDDSTGNFTFIKDASNNSEVFSGTMGTIEGLTLKSTVASGTAPLTVASSTLVTNLNADLLEGLNPSQFMRSDGNTTTTGNVGIGSSNPSRQLDVSGNMLVSGNGLFTGNVGIGTSIPTTKLDIVGILKATGLQINDITNAFMPRGGIIMWSGTVATIPTGWTLCDGNNGTPDLQGKFLIGSSTTYTQGTSGGSANKTLTLANMPAHNHSGTTNTDGSHQHNVQGGVSCPVGSARRQLGADSVRNDVLTDYGGSHTHTFTTDTKGSGTAFDILPPYYALAYIMKL